MVVRELTTLLGFQLDETNKKKYEASFTKLKDTAIKFIAALGLADISKKMVGLASAQEQIAMQFTTALGSAEKASELMEKISKFSLQTGMEKEAINGYAKQLLYMGMTADEIMPTLTTLGNIAAGVGKEKLPMLVESMYRMKQTGKVDSRVFFQFIREGIPVIEQLKKDTGMTTTQLKKMGNEGVLTYAQVNKALQELTGTGGKFDNLLMKQANTMQGIFSRIKSTLGELGEKLGGDLLPVIKEVGLKILEFLGGNFEKIRKIGDVVFGALAFGLGFLVGVLERVGKAIGTSGIGKNLENIGKDIMPFLNQIKIAIGSFWKGLSSQVDFSKVVDLFTALAGLIHDIFTGMPEGNTAMKDLGKFLGDIAGLSFNALVEMLTLLVDLLDDLLKMDFSKTLQNLGDMLMNVSANGQQLAAMTARANQLEDALKKAGKSTTEFNKQLEAAKKNPAQYQRVLDVWGVKIEQKGTQQTKVPSFAKGVENFEGGLAYVHKNELLANLPKSTSIYNNMTSKTGANNPSTHFHISGTNITIGVPAGTSEFQKQNIKENVKIAMNDWWQENLRQLSAQKGRLDYSGVSQ
jgi:tape measure domain-containing protein